MTTKRYSELILLPTFEDRVEYLKLDGKVGQDSFGFDRYLNQLFYRSSEWKKVRDKVIMRDNASDLAFEGHILTGRILIHHINPISETDIIERSPRLLDLQNLVCVSPNTHNLIHYGILEMTYTLPDRAPNDTCPWK